MASTLSIQRTLVPASPVGPRSCWDLLTFAQLSGSRRGDEGLLSVPTPRVTR